MKFENSFEVIEKPAFRNKSHYQNVYQEKTTPSISKIIVNI